MCAVLLMGMLPLTVSAATEEEEAALKRSTELSYYMARSSTGKDSLRGFCGMMTSHQLYHMGINSSLLTYDGNQQFDAYKDLFKTTGGYYVRSYPVSEYTLEEALNAISWYGTRDVYNMVVGFQWTNTQAGAKFGHSCVVNGILNGKVYFMEGFYTPFGGPEGNISICTISEFAAYFGKWTRFEGIVYFGTGQYADACLLQGTDIFVRSRLKMPLRSQPYILGQEGSQVLRTIAAGERLRVTGILENAVGELYYQVQDGTQVGYIVADTATLERTNTEDLRTANLQIPERMSAGVDTDFGGTVYAKNGMVGAVEMVITDQNGKEVLRQQKTTDCVSYDLADLSKAADLSKLERGAYKVRLYGQTAAAFVRDSAMYYSREKVLLHEQTILVGGVAQPRRTATTVTPKLADGWCWQEGSWYCYDNGQPLSGWVRDRGVNYYLDEGGIVTTGVARIDGTAYYFSPSGAQCIGWVRTEEGMRYYMQEGGWLTGWQTIDGGRYYFREDGLMQTGGTATDGVKTYEIQSDGRAMPVAAKPEK